MIDFVTSLNKGLELAQQADENNKEIDSVFAELNRQLNEVYAGKVVIERHISKDINLILNTEIYSYPDHSVKDRMVIVATNRRSETESIANWAQAPRGYPCSIAFAGQKHICEDKESLELAIADLLANPSVAKILLKVISEK